MDQYLSLRSEMIALNNEVSHLLKQSQEALGGAGEVFSQWNRTCTAIERHLMDHVVRIAVVGAIKSGKSTLVNSWLGKDYLKRGAGVVTSIVTRIRKGPQLKARLFFKSWDEINDEIQQALVLFPADQWQSEDKPFDIRRKADRANLSTALDALDADLRLAQDHLNANSVLLSSYLKGYEQIAALVGPERTIQEFEADDFGDHRDFVGNDAMAVYLRDVELEIAGESLASNIEMADCQGSDSPNPLHMAMIQDYLLKAHLVVYVISSRTGVRQADIRFLSMIKKMGIAGNMMFVCNCDLNEHADVRDLQTLVERIREDIGMILPETKIFCFSALYNLFGALEADLGERDRERLSQWRKCGDLVAFSDERSRRLDEELNDKLSRDRASLLLRNQLERLDVLTAGLRQWLRLNQDLIRRDAGEARTMALRARDHQGHIQQVQSMIQSTLEGAARKIKKDLRKNVDRFFDSQSGIVVSNALHFVRNHRLDLEGFRETLAASGFTHTLYLVFQAFKQGVDGYMAQTVNPEIIGFIGQQEVYINEAFKSVAEPYEAMVRNALAQFEEAMTQVGVETCSQDYSLDLTPDLESIKHIVGLNLPPAAASMRYSAHVKTDAVLHFGFYALVRMVRKALRKPLDADAAEQLKALKDGIRRMKREMEKSIVAQFKDYQENVKFQYLLRLADLAGRRLYETLTEHFHGYSADLKQLLDSIGGERLDKEELNRALEAVGQALEEIKSRIVVLREQVARLQHQPAETMTQADAIAGTNI
ncbi:MAG: dynamin family protein [Desulfosarcinaceae bacterium]